MLDSDLKGAALRGSERWSGTLQDRASLTKNDLMKLVRKFDGQFQPAERAVPAVDQVARESSDFLVQEIFRAAQGDIFNADIRCVRLFGVAESKTRLGCAADRELTLTEPQVKAGKKCCREQSRPCQRNVTKASPFLIRQNRRFDLRSFRHNREKWLIGQQPGAEPRVPANAPRAYAAGRPRYRKGRARIR